MSRLLDAERLLLRAALLDGSAARSALAAWKVNAPAGLDTGSRRLLPLLHLNLQALGMAEAEEPRLKDAFARATRANAALVEAVAPVLGALAGEGIACAALKGLPLALCYYPAAGARPMGDVDLLVRPAHAGTAHDVLVRAGWRPDAPVGEAVVATVHAMRFTGPGGLLVDLHWHMQPEMSSDEADEETWAAMEEIEVGGAKAWMPCPADLLLHACVHGMRWSTTPPVRWAADAMMILKKAGSRLHWRRLVDRTRRHGLSLPMLDALRFLRETLDAPVPDAVVNDLARVAVSRAQRIEYAVKLRPRTRVRLLMLHWFQHRRLTNGTVVDDVVRFPRYLRRLWNTRPR